MGPAFIFSSQAHTVEVRYCENNDGSVTLYGGTYHNTSGPRGGIIVDGVTYNFTTVHTTAALPVCADLIIHVPAYNNPGNVVAYQGVTIFGLSAGPHDITFTLTSAIEAPWPGAFPISFDYDGGCENDLVAPEITCAANQAQTNDAGNCSANVAVAAPTYSDNCTMGGSTAVDFTGTSYMVGPDDVVPVTGEFTVCVWAQQLVNGGFTEIFAQGRKLYLGESNVGDIRVGDSWAGTGVPFPQDNQWHHYAIVRELSDTHLYIDGVLEASKGSSIPSPGVNGTDPHNLLIGSQWSPGEYFQGNIDEFQIWDVALSQELISCNKDQRLLGTEPNLVGYYNFEDGTGSTVLTNIVNSSHNGTLVNMDVNAAWIASPQPSNPVNIFNDYNGSCVASDVYPVGTTTVTWTATDNSGNSAICTQDITVTDDEDPIITCPNDMTVSADPGTCEAASVDLGMATTTDNCNSTTTSNDAPTSYVLGDNVVTWTANDGNGQSVICTQIVTVEDNENPTITCPDDITVSTDPGTCEAVSVDLGTATTTDNCTSTTTSNDAPASYVLGDNIVTWTADDGNGQSVTCTQIVTVEDDEDPIITCPNDMTLNNDAGECGAVVDFEAAADDNCSVSITYSQDPGTVFPVGITEVTATATDPSGNFAICIFTVTVNDTEDPIITCAADHAQSNELGVCGATVSVVGPDFSDNCGAACNEVYSDQILSSVASFSGDETLINFDDIVIEPDGFTQLIGGEYSSLGVNISSPVEFSATTYYPVISSANSLVSFNNNSCPCGPIELSFDDPQNRIGFHLYTNTGVSSVVLTCTKDGEVVGTESFPTSAAAYTFIGVESMVGFDEVLISAPSNGAMILDDLRYEGCQWTAINDYNLTDNASGFYPVGTTPVTWTITDAAGNTSECIQNIIVTDDENPTWLNEPSDMIVECDATDDPSNAFANWLSSFTGSDNCSAIDVVNNSVGLSDLCGATGTETVTFTMTDDSGNSVSADATFTIVDTSLPVWSTLPSDLLLECDGTTDIGGAIDTWLANLGGGTVSDACSDLTITNDYSSFTCPTINSYDGEWLTGDPTFTGGDCWAFETNAPPTPMSVYDLLEFEVTEAGDYTFTMANSNTFDGIAAIFAGNFDPLNPCDNMVGGDDDIAPGFNATEPIITLALAEGTHYLVSSTWGSTNAGSFSWTFSGPAEFQLPCDACSAFTGSALVTFNAIDECGNGMSAQANITVVDTTDPVWDLTPTDMTVECDGSVGASGSYETWLASFSGSDVCSDVTYSHNATGLSDICGATGTETVTFTLTDECGNSISMDATFTIEDTTDPLWYIAPSDMTVECDGTEGASGNYDSWLDSFLGTDICGGAEVTHNALGLSNGCGATGSETVTFTLTDECGNSISMDATFTIEDTVSPEMICPSDMMTCADQDIVTGAVVTWDEVTSSDVCGDVIITSSHNSGDVFDVGVTTVNYTATDECGNITTCSFDITVFELPELEILESENSIYCQGYNVNLTASVISITGGITYDWSTGEDTESIEVSASETYSVIVTDANGCTRETSYVVDFSPSDLISAYTIIGEKEVHLKDDNQVLNGGVGVIDANKKAKIKKNTLVIGSTTFVSADDIDVDNSSTVDTEIFDNVTAALPAFLSNPHNSNNDETVNNGATVVLSGSIYGKIKVKKDAHVTFTQKDIYMESLDIDDGSTVNFTGCAFVRIEKKLMIDNDVTINDDGAQVHFYVGDHADVKEGSTVNASIYALQHIHAKGKSGEPTFMNGRFIGEKVKGDNFVSWDYGSVCDATCLPDDQAALLANDNIGNLESSSSQLQVDQIIEQNQKRFAENLAIKLYPIPAINQVNIDIKDRDGLKATILFINNLGQRVLEHKVKALDNSPQTIMIDDLNSGIYTLLISVEGERMITKSLVVVK